MAERKVTIRVQAKDEASGAVMSANRSFRSLGQTLDALKNVAGGRSTAKDFLEILRGSGPIAAVGLAARTLSEIGRAMSDTADQMARGDLASQDMGDHLIKMVPIVGRVYEGFKDAAMAVAGLTAQLSIANAESAQLERTTGVFRGSFRTAEEFSGRAQNAVGRPDAMRSVGRDAAAARASITTAQIAERRKLREELRKAETALGSLEENAGGITGLDVANRRLQEPAIAAARARVTELNQQISASERAQSAAFQQIERDKQAALIEIQRDGERTRFNERMEQQDREQQQAKQSARRLADVWRQITENTLRMQGRHLQAEMMGIEALLSDRLDEIEKLRQEAIGRGANAGQAGFDAQRLRDAAGIVAQQERQAVRARSDEEFYSRKAAIEAETRQLALEMRFNAQERRFERSPLSAYAPTNDSRFGTGFLDRQADFAESRSPGNLLLEKILNNGEAMKTAMDQHFRNIMAMIGPPL